MKRIFQAIDEGFFRYGSPVTMGVFRILVGTFAFINFAMIAIDFEAWFGETGFVPVQIGDRAIGDQLRINLLSGVANTNVTFIFYALTMFAALLTALGLWSRVSSIALAIGVISLHHRNILILHGGDTLLRLCCIYVALSPSGAACSLDRLIGLWKGTAPDVPAQVSLWPQRLVVFQVALLYFTSVWQKAFGSAWREGWATYYPMNLREFDRFWTPEFIEHQPFLAITTYGTLAIELAMATLVFYRPMRKWVLASALVLHAWIEYSMNIPLFEWVMVSTYIAFYQGDEISAWAKRVGEKLRRFHLQVFLPKGTQLHRERGRMIQATDAFSLITYEPGLGEDFLAVDAKKRSRNVTWSTLSRSLGAWVMLPVPWVWRSFLGRALETTSGAAPQVKPPSKPKHATRSA